MSKSLGQRIKKVSNI